MRSLTASASLVVLRERQLHARRRGQVGLSLVAEVVIRDAAHGRPGHHPQDALVRARRRSARVGFHPLGRRALVLDERRAGRSLRVVLDTAAQARHDAGLDARDLGSYVGCATLALLLPGELRRRPVDGGPILHEPAMRVDPVDGRRELGLSAVTADVDLDGVDEAVADPLRRRSEVLAVVRPVAVVDDVVAGLDVVVAAIPVERPLGHAHLPPAHDGVVVRIGDGVIDELAVDVAELQGASLGVGEQHQEVLAVRERAVHDALQAGVRGEYRPVDGVLPELVHDPRHERLVVGAQRDALAERVVSRRWADRFASGLPACICACAGRWSGAPAACPPGP